MRFAQGTLRPGFPRFGNRARTDGVLLEDNEGRRRRR